MKSEYDYTWEPANKMSGDFVLKKPRSIAKGSKDRRRGPPQEHEEQVSLENLLID